MLLSKTFYVTLMDLPFHSLSSVFYHLSLTFFIQQIFKRGDISLVDAPTDHTDGRHRAFIELREIDMLPEVCVWPIWTPCEENRDGTLRRELGDQLGDRLLGAEASWRTFVIEFLGG